MTGFLKNFILKVDATSILDAPAALCGGKMAEATRGRARPRVTYRASRRNMARQYGMDWRAMPRVGCINRPEVVGVDEPGRPRREKKLGTVFVAPAWLLENAPAKA